VPVVVPVVARDRARRVVARARQVRSAAMRCIDCDFDLARTTEGRCPECGRGFDPRDPGTWIGAGHSRFSERLARAPGWPMLALAAVVACIVFDTGFAPGSNYGGQIPAAMACLAFSLVLFVRVAAGFVGHLTLPRRVPRVVPIQLSRWLLPPAIIVVAVVLVATGAVCELALVLDRSVLEQAARGAPVQPSKWTAVRAWSGTVARGAVWDDVGVWAFDPQTPLGKSARPFEGGALRDAANDAYNARVAGMGIVPGTVDVQLARLAVFPVEGTGYARGQAAAWAYAPGAPDMFGLQHSFFVRQRGDWFISHGWMHPLEDRP